MKGIERIRRNAAEAALTDWDQAVNLVHERYDRKHKLRVALEQDTPAGIKGSLDGLTLNIKYIREVANALHSNRIPEDIDYTLKTAENKLEHLAVLLGEARKLSSDLTAPDIDQTTLAERKKRLHRSGIRGMVKDSDALLDLHNIWDEAFALISGLCVRHEGLDGGLCQIADAIIEEINWVQERVFTVPGRGNPGTVSQIVHLAFPEWSIWALPLTANSLWNLAIRDKNATYGNISTDLLRSMLEVCSDNSKELEDSARMLWTDQSFQDCLADVFGVFSLGPAYACACICQHLALDPTNKNAEQRALAMFHVLSLEPDYQTIVEYLQRQWREIVPTPGTLNHKSWIEATFTFLNEEAFEFNAARWRELRGVLVPAMRAGQVDAIDCTNLQCRYLLSAAWKARVEIETEKPFEVSRTTNTDNDVNLTTVVKSFKTLSKRALDRHRPPSGTSW